MLGRESSEPIEERPIDFYIVGPAQDEDVESDSTQHRPQRLGTWRHQACFDPADRGLGHPDPGGERSLRDAGLVPGGSYCLGCVHGVDDSKDAIITAESWASGSGG